MTDNRAVDFFGRNKFTLIYKCIFLNAMRCVFLVEYNFYEFVSKVQLLQDYNRLSSNKSFPQNSREELKICDGWLFSVLDITGMNVCCPTYGFMILSLIIANRGCPV